MKNFKKILCLLLCVLLIIPCVLTLSSCSKKEVKFKVDKKTVEVDLTGYSVVKDAKISGLFYEWLVQMTNQLKDQTGANIKITSDKSADYEETEDLEILVGDTKRIETQKALKKIKGNGYVIQVFDNKIVIAGTTNALTMMAMQYFVENYIPAEKTKGTLTMNKRVLMSNVQLLDLINQEGTSDYSVVYSGSLDDNNNLDEGAPEADKKGDYIDMTVSNARSGAAQISKLVSSVRNVPKTSDTADSRGPEIQYGIVNRPDAQAALKQLKMNEYGVFANENGNIVVTSWNDTGVDCASTVFNSLLESACTTDDDGNKHILLPSNLKLVSKMVDNGWVTDYPTPEKEGIELAGVIDVGNKSLQCNYAGSGVSAQAYQDYCKTLTDAGYSRYSDNTIEENIYRTYISQDKTHTLYVVYAAYKYAEEQKVNYYNANIRVISAPLDGKDINLVKKEYLTPDKNVYPYTPSITTVRLNYATNNFGMNYVIMLGDGSFIVYDGGGDGKDASAHQANDHERLYNVLKDLFLYTKGHEPTASDPIVITGWFVTHQHWDHITVLKDFCRAYGKQVKIEGLYANFLSKEECFNAYNPESSLMNAMTSYLDYTNGEMIYYKVHSGMKLYIKGAELEVLYTHEDLYPKRISYFNDSSTIIRYTLRQSGGQAVTATFLGDLYMFGSRAIRAMFSSNKLKCDVVQVAHHGYQAVEKELYKLMSPELLLWPTSSAQWLSQVKDSNKNGNRTGQVDYYIANELESVKYIIVQDQKCTTIFIRINGLDYTDLYSPVDGGDVVFTEKVEGSKYNYLIRK